MALLKSANLALAFLLELCMLAALGYWGFKTGQSWIARIGLGLGAPLLFAVVWGVFLSPRAAIQVSAPVHLVLELAVFGCAAAALAAAGHPGLAVAFAIIVVLNLILQHVWQQ